MNGFQLQAIRLPSAKRMRALLAAAAALLAAPSGKRRQLLLRQAVDLLHADAAVLLHGFAATAYARNGMNRPRDAGPAELLAHAGTLPRVSAYARRDDRPAGVGQALYSIAPPLNNLPASALCIYYHHPLSPRARNQAANVLRLLHSSAITSLGGSPHVRPPRKPSQTSTPLPQRRRL